MKRYQKIIAVVSLGIFSFGANAVPNVATDITPVHSLVSQVMAGVGKPDLLVQSGASPHHYSLSPSEAEALQEADLVFWIGEGLTPWLERSLENLSPDSKKIELLEAKGTTTYAFREGATFDAHDDNDLETEEETAHDTDDNDHEIEEETAHGTNEDAHHDHSGIDPHAWLDPANGKVWLDVIARALVEKDPENATKYLENAAIGKAEIDAAISLIEATTVQFNSKQFIVFHDAYQYFERRFKIQAAGSISISDASKPSPARIAEIIKVVADLNVSCVFTEPQYNPGVVKAVFGGTGVNTSGVIDPLGSGLVIGVNLYPNLLIKIAEGLQSCLGEK
jgi:zinc transport system substrate-binding protein